MTFVPSRTDIVFLIRFHKSQLKHTKISAELRCGERASAAAKVKNYSTLNFWLEKFFLQNFHRTKKEGNKDTKGEGEGGEKVMEFPIFGNFRHSFLFRLSGGSSACIYVFTTTNVGVAMVDGLSLSSIAKRRKWNEIVENDREQQLFHSKRETSFDLFCFPFSII